MNRILIITIAFTLCSLPALAQETSGGFLDGSIRVGYDNRTCNAGLEGSIRYNSSTNSWTQCDGTSWASLGSGGGGLWSDSGSGYIEYSSSLGGILVGGMTGLSAPAMP